MSDFFVENGVLTEYTGAGGDVVIPDGVQNIGINAFQGCNALTGIRIPGNVTQIGNWTFKSCENLTIHAPVGSYAEQYAGENNIRFAAE